MKTRKKFTLIELLVVIAIIGNPRLNVITRFGTKPVQRLKQFLASVILNN